jgi:hypothetical protein
MRNYTIYTPNNTKAMKSVINGWDRHHREKREVHTNSRQNAWREEVRKCLHRQKATLKRILKKDGVRVENGLTCLTLGTNETGYYEQGNKRLKQGRTNPGRQVAVATKFVWRHIIFVGSSAWNLLHVNFLTPTNFKWFQKDEVHPRADYVGPEGKGRYSPNLKNSHPRCVRKL